MWAQYDKVMLWYSLLVSDFASDFIQNKELGGSLCEEKKKKIHLTLHFKQEISPVLQIKIFIYWNLGHFTKTNRNCK